MSVSDPVSQKSGIERRDLLVQAPVKALDADGVGIAVVGTSAFAVAALTCWLNLAALSETGREWWLWVALTGVGIGVLGAAYAIHRSRRRRKLSVE